MQKLKLTYHLLFWILLFLYTLHVLEYDCDLIQAIFLAFIKVSFCLIVFYINLFFLIPYLLLKINLRFYLISLSILSIFIYLIAYNLNIGNFYEDSNNRMALAYLVYYIQANVISITYWYFFYKQEKHNCLLLQNEKLKAELLLLKSQVSPHFLFNSLNNIYSLSITKNDNASLMIAKLSDILRYIIYEGKNKEVHLDREVSLLKNYIDLQLLKKPKAEKNIKFTYTGVQSSHKIVPLLLINIVENCFKHSNITYIEMAFLKIMLKVKDDQLCFYASNSFIPNRKKSGEGLDNIKQLLQQNYPDRHLLKISDNGVIFTVKLQINLLEEKIPLLDCNCK